MYRHRQHYSADKYVKVCICERRRKRNKDRTKNQQNVFAWPGRENLSRLFLRFMRWWWYMSELYSPSFRWPLSSWTYWRREKSVYNAWVPISVDVYNNTSLLSIPGQTVCGSECYSPPCQDPWGGQREDAWSFASEKSEWF